MKLKSESSNKSTLTSIHNLPTSHKIGSNWISLISRGMLCVILFSLHCLLKPWCLSKLPVDFQCRSSQNQIPTSQIMNIHQILLYSLKTQLGHREVGMDQVEFRSPYREKSQLKPKQPKFNSQARLEYQVCVCSKTMPTKLHNQVA